MRVQIILTLIASIAPILASAGPEANNGSLRVAERLHEQQNPPPKPPPKPPEKVPPPPGPGGPEVGGPRFAGTWVLDSPAGAPAGAKGGPALSITVKQDANTLIVETGTTTLKYALDGSASANATPAGSKSVSVAKWDRNRLIITTKTGDTETTQVWSVANDVLTIERASNSGSSKQIYKRKMG